MLTYKLSISKRSCLTKLILLTVVCAGVFGMGQSHCGPECVPNLLCVLKRGCYLFATVNQQVYEENKEEWKQQIKDCNCELIEANEMPYRDAAKAVVVVIHKPLRT